MVGVPVARVRRLLADQRDGVLGRPRVAGGVLSFYFRETVMPYYGGAYAEFYRAGVNNFMYWELMRHAARRGFTRFDFGRSKAGTGAYEFKRGWGMEALLGRIEATLGNTMTELEAT